MSRARLEEDVGSDPDREGYTLALVADGELDAR
jgi:hypothetical protein